MFGKIDYWVTGVSYKKIYNKRYIDSLEAHPNIGFTHNYGELWSREAVAKKLEVYIFATIVRNRSGDWKKLGEIKRVNVDGQVFLRVDGMKIPEDNLGKLPEIKKA